MTVGTTSTTTTQPVTQPRFLPWLIEHRAQIDAVFLDIDGVLATARKALPGSQELVDWLRQHNVPLLLLTNDGCNSPRQKLRYLRDSGLHFRTNEIVSTSHALVELVAANDWAGKLFFMMGELGHPCYAEAAGLHITRDPQRIRDCTGVVVGEKKYDWNRAITAAFNHLIRHPEAPLIIPNPDEYFATHGGLLQPASGATGRFVQQLCRTYGVDITPIYLGKPYSPIYRFAQHRLESRLGHKVSAKRIVMVGDSLASDIRGGHNCGFRTALVLSGITTPQMLATCKHPPDQVFIGL